MSQNELPNGSMKTSNVNHQTACDTKESNFNNPMQENTKESERRQHVRNIPIYVEGRNEPVLNNDIDSGPSFAANRSNDIPKPGSSSIFSRVKEIPVKSFIPSFENSRRSTSPARNIPIHVQHTSSAAQQQQPQSFINQQAEPPIHQQPQFRKSPSPCPADPITKIQYIQSETIELMEKVEHFNGTRKSKDYVYLDEMLTQNLLKLDTINTDGKDNIKAARKEVINCINKCISVLETKASVCEANTSNHT